MVKANMPIRSRITVFTDEMTQLLALRAAFIGTVTVEGGPEMERRHVQVSGERTLIFPEFTDSTTLQNLRRNRHVTVVAWSGAALPYGKNRAYKFTGTAELHTRGSLFAVYAEPKPQYVVSVTIDQVHRHLPGRGWTAVP